MASFAQHNNSKNKKNNEEQHLLHHSMLSSVLSPDEIQSMTNTHLKLTASASPIPIRSYGANDDNTHPHPHPHPPHRHHHHLQNNISTSISPQQGSISQETPASLQSLLNVNYGTFTTKSAARLSVLTKMVVPYYMLSFLFCILGLAMFYITPRLAQLHLTVFSVFLCVTIAGSVVGMFCEYKWSAITAFRELLRAKNKEWRTSIDGLKAAKRALHATVQDMQFSIDRLGHSAAELEVSLHEFDALKNELEKLTTKSQQVTDVLDDLIHVCNTLRQLMREHAKTELMCAYYDAAVFCRNHRTNSIRLTGSKWKNFRARLDSKTRKVFDEKGGFEALDQDGDGLVYIEDLTQVLSFVIDERGFDEIYQKIWERA